MGPDHRPHRENPGHVPWFRAGSFVMSLWPITGLDPPRPPIDAREIVPFIIARRPGGPQ